MSCVAVFIFQAFLGIHLVFEEHHLIRVRILDKESKGNRTKSKIQKVL